VAEDERLIFAERCVPQTLRLSLVHSFVAEDERLIDAERMTAPRTGFFYNFGKGELVARRWDPQQEDIGKCDTKLIGMSHES
jgi:hypothetical protein